MHLYRIWFFNGSFYLIGYSHKRAELRIFALDRIEMLHQTKETFEVPEGFSMEMVLNKYEKDLSEYYLAEGEAIEHPS